MGNLTAKTSGEIANFMTPTKTNIKSLKVHFSPKQLGEGDPSPENVREIVGWDGVEVNGSGKNIAHIVGYSAKNSDSNNSRNISNSYGTTINTTEFSLPDTKLIITQTQYPNTTVYHYQNGYCEILVDNLIWEQEYNVSFKIDNIINNPLNAELKDIKLLNPYGKFYSSIVIDDNHVVFKNVLWKQYSNTTVNRRNFEIRICGMSFTLSEFMVTPVDEDDFEYEPYQGNIYSKEWTKNLLDIWERPNGYKPLSNENGNYNWSKEWIVTNELKGKTITYSTFIDNTNANGNGYVHIWTKNSEGNYIKTSIIPPSNKQIIAGESGWSYVNLILTDDIYSVVFGITISANATAKYPMVELGSEPTEYQPYVGTVYGGYIDLISGELVEESKLWTKNTSEMNSGNSSFSGWWNCGFKSIIGEVNRAFNLKTNSSYMLNVGTYFSANTTGNYDNLYLPNSTYNLTQDEWKEKAIDVKIVAPLATPITHQLTPTQLKSFVGQNNFWSNADYVEIEYDLIETEDIQKCRKKIILNQPQLKTISDKIVSFNTDMVAPMKNCKIYFKPIQLGSGDASPTNVRNINGWTGLDSYVNGNKVSVDWTNDIGTVYGGYVDLVKGELVATQVGVRKKLSEATTKGQNSNGVYQYNFNFAIPYGQILNKYGSQKCSVCGYSWSMSDFQQNHFFGYYSESTGNRFLLFLLEDHGLNDDAEIDFMSELTSPVTFQLTPQQLLTLKSTNHIWSETNGQQIDVKYWTHKNLIPTPLVNYLENQTWTDSAYISSTGKKTTNTVSASHFLTNQILLEAGTYVLSGFSYYAGSDSTRYRIHAYDSTGKWLRQIAFQQIGNLSPVDISFTLDTDTYVNLSIAMDFDGVLAKIN